MSSRNQIVSLAESQPQVIDSTNPGCALNDRVEHRLHVRRRPADDTEHLGRCRLMLQRLSQFRVALLDLFEEPDVLDCDDCLISKRFKECDLLVGERTNLFATNGNSSNSVSFAQERRSNHTTCTSNFVNGLGIRKLSANFR